MKNTGSTPPYHIILKNKVNPQSLDKASLFILFTALVACLARAVYLTATIVIIVSLLLLILTGWWLYGVFNKKPASRFSAIIIAITAVYFFIQLTGLGFFMGIMLALTFWFDKRLKREPHVTISSSGVTVITFFALPFTWQQLNNVIIKDGVLTVDTKSNRLIQKELANDITTADEAEINEFCRLNIAANGAGAVL
ncbi:MAG TPA: hypothetical protein VHB48_20140 [Chitinophagaceae bacterium]|nr:hypothetical protein [Chitinophagaceae bacterium]